MPKSSIKDRLGKVFMNLKGVDTILLINTEMMDPNFSYLTGLTNGFFEDNLVAATREKLYLLTNPLDYETAAAHKKPGMLITNVTSSAKSKAWLRKHVKGKKIGINASFLPAATYMRIKKNLKPKSIANISDAFYKARISKDEGELDSMRKAISITKMAMLQVQRYFKEGMTETQLAAHFDYITSSLGGKIGPMFPTIVSFGKNSAIPHHLPDDTKLSDGDFILIDAGCTVDNYYSDLTRTFIFGKQDPMKIEMMKIVKDAQLRAIRMMKPGMKGSEPFKAANDHINTAAGGKYKGKFIHTLGHSLGLEVHDGPARMLSPNSDTVLSPGMVTSVEPGIYLTGYGGVRIEDDVLITEDGTIVL